MHPFILATALSTMVPTGPVSWSFAAKPVADGAVAVALTATVGEGWHIYATQLENDLGPIPTTIRFEKNDALVRVGELAEPKPEEVFDPNFEMQVRYHSGTPVFVQRFKNTGAAQVVTGEVEFMVCNDKTCLPPEVVKFSIDVPAADVKP
ncbi:MAG: protein-disulfide reductase DsbD N-terminal domain-containing protein [Flavobacteriales bacterium]|nr:protein-disulfide reductase DsbD N-terminal domain-containing protein [Flavobacteriales bacterium]